MLWRRVTVLVLLLSPLAASVGLTQATPEDSVRALEAARVQALIHQDTVALSRMLAPEFNEISRLGTIRTRADNIRDIASGMLRLTSIRQDSLTVRVYGDVAVLQGIAYQVGSFGGTPFTGKVRYTRVFVRRDGRWQAVTVQQTVAP